VDAVEINVESLETLQVLPPRRVFWDYVPNWIFLPLRMKFGIPPTPREVWYIHNLALRATFGGLYAMFVRTNDKPPIEGAIPYEELN